MSKKKKDIEVILSRSDERFCNEYALTSNATQSYLKAHVNASYNTARTEGSRLLAKPSIGERIAQIKEADAVQWKQTKDGTIKDLINTAEEAKEAGQFSAYAKMREMVIKIVGFYEPEKIDVRSQQTVINYIKPLKDGD